MSATSLSSRRRGTIRRWRERTTTADRSHRPKRMTISLTPLEETLVRELRTQLDLPLDDIVESLSSRRRG